MRHTIIREKTLALGPPKEYYFQLASLSDERTSDGQVRAATAEGVLYKRQDGQWEGIAPLNLEGFRQVHVQDIDDPSEMTLQAPRGNKREIVVASADNGQTMYRFEFGQHGGQYAGPYVIDSANSDGFWVAIGGKYFAGQQNVLATEDVAVTISGDGTNLLISNTMKYDTNLLAGGSADQVADSAVPSASINIQHDGNTYSLVLWSSSAASIPDNVAIDTASSVPTLNNGTLSSFEPTSSLLPGVVMWADVMDFDSISETAGRVSQINNKANGTKNIVQANYSMMPERVPDAFYPRITGVYFDGSRNMEAGTGWHGYSDYLIAVAFRNVIDIDNSGTPDGLVSISAGPSSHMSLGTNAGGTFTARIATAQESVSVSLQGSVQSGTNNVLYLHATQSNIKVYANGESASAAIVDGFSVSSLATMHIGRWMNLSNVIGDPANGWFGDIIVVGRNVTITQQMVDNVTNFLKFKYKADQ